MNLADVVHAVHGGVCTTLLHTRAHYTRTRAGTPEGVGRLSPGDLVEAWAKEPGTGRLLSHGSWLCTAAPVSKL